MPFQSFIVKYPEFVEEENRYDAFLSDATIEVDIYQWGTLRGIAIELLVAHKIILSSPFSSSSESSGGLTSGVLKKINVQDNSYEVEYQDSYKSSNSSSDYASTRYGAEYLRLLKIITGTSAEKPEVPINGIRGTSYIGKRGRNFLPW